METAQKFEVIIIGGSYAGLSAAMSLGRSLRNVLVIDSGKPCNIQTPHSHNFITQDGKTPKQISSEAKEQVKKYKTIKFHEGVAIQGIKNKEGFEITTDSGALFQAKKLIFATGIKDQIPKIPGFSTCWGISVIHCPYCHGYEVRGEKTGILSNGDDAFEFGKLISNWTDDLTIFTNGKSTLSIEQTQLLKKHGITVNENEILTIIHQKGYIDKLTFIDGTDFKLKALYARIPFTQHCSIPEELGCELTPQGHLKVDSMQKTTVENVLACGDNTTMMRAVAISVSSGNFAGAVANKDLVNDNFLRFEP